MTKRNEARNAEWARLYADDGLSVYEIGERFGVHGGTVWWNLKQMGVERRPIPEHVKGEEYKQFHAEWADQYKKGADAYEIAERYGVSGPSVYRALELQGVPRRSLSEAARKHQMLNERAFEAVDTDAKAYWLGFLLADGNVMRELGTKKVGVWVLQVALQERDRDHLVKLADFLGTDHFLTQRKATRCYNFVRHSERLVQDLMRCGCIPRKSLVVQFPPPDIVPVELLGAFVRGYLDGNGWVCRSKRKRTYGIRIGWACASPEFLQTLHDILLGRVGVSRITWSKPKNTKCQTLSTENRPDVERLYHWMYDGATVYLPRKKAKFEELLGITNLSTEGAAI